MAEQNEQIDDLIDILKKMAEVQLRFQNELITELRSLPQKIADEIVRQADSD